MKVLFAVNNESISEQIVKKYQKEYKEIISYKNVYYFNAILKELQKDRSYDRIVIGEDLEQFTNSSYEQMDKFIFDRLDSISDEASNNQGNDIPIILICSDRRNKGEQILVKLFGIGIYNAIIGTDRSVDEVCRLIYRPRIKKEAKLYYRIDVDDVAYQSENENDVSEMEIQNILAHYKRLGRQEERYVESFDNIAAQYNDKQLKIICKFLPLNVKAVLEEQSPKYQKLMAFNSSVSNQIRKTDKQIKKENGITGKMLTSNSKEILTKPVVIPSNMHTNSVTRMTKRVEQPVRPQPTPTQFQQPVQPITPIQDLDSYFNDDEEEEVVQPVVQEPKRGRGRPRKNPIPQEQEIPQTPKRGRGRPRKNSIPEPVIEEPILPMTDYEQQDDEISEFNNMNNNQINYNNNNTLPGFDDYEEENDNVLPGFDNNVNNSQKDYNNSNTLPGFDDYEDKDDYSYSNYNSNSNMNMQNNNTFDNQSNSYNTQLNQSYSNSGYTSNNDYMNNTTNYTTGMATTNSYEENQNYITSSNVANLLTGNKKLVTFVGTSKNGTSFVINNLAQLLSSMGINTAILDTTENRNSYYIYTKNEEDLRKIAYSSINKLVEGTASGIKVNPNLTVYTSLPDQNHTINNSGPILETLVKNHSVVLIDCDFSTPYEYFKESQEIYLVQSMDVLTIQPLTAFLRDLKAKNILDESKIRIVINKYTKVRSVTEKTIIGGMAFYNDPAMSFMTELFDRNIVKYVILPFEEETYTRYLEALVNCEMSLKGYSKTFVQYLKQLGNMVYPLVSGRGTYKPTTSNYNSNGFSSTMNDTLNQMKRNY